MFVRRQLHRSGALVYWVCEETRTPRGPRQTKVCSLRHLRSVAAAVREAEWAVQRLGRIVDAEAARERDARRALRGRPSPRSEAGKERAWRRRLERQLAREVRWLERLRELPALSYPRHRSRPRHRRAAPRRPRR